MFHKHTYNLNEEKHHDTYIIFKFYCSGCGHPFTKVVEIGSKFEFEVE